MDWLVIHSPLRSSLLPSNTIPLEKILPSLIDDSSWGCGPLYLTVHQPSPTQHATMAPPPQSNENQRKEEETNNNNDDPKSSSSFSSWFGSWFERDTRNEIHEQLNAFDEREKQYEEEQKDHRRFLEQHASSSSFPFPFFFPPEHDNDNEFQTGGGGGANNIRDEQHKDDFEDIFGGRFPRPRWQGGFVDGDDNNVERCRRRGPFESDDIDNSKHQREEPRIDDIHQEMQNLFEAAFAGGMMHPPPSQSGRSNKGLTSSSSSSSTTVVSNSNGTSYTMKQDSRNGARVDLKLPSNCESENVSLEVLNDRPCLIRWRDNNHHQNGTGSDISKHRANTDNTNQQHNGQVLELGDSVDCSRLSASISEAKHTLTVEAPPKGKPGSASADGEEEPPLLLLKPTNNSYPRLVRVTKKQ